MEWKNTGCFWKIGLAATGLVFSVSGCGDVPSVETLAIESESEVWILEKDSERIETICQELYEKAVEQNKSADLETIRSIVNQFGENGYPAVDSRNQVDMTETEQVVHFCEMVVAGKEAEINIIEVNYQGGFVKYNLQTKDGHVDVVRDYYKYENGYMQRKFTGHYRAENWDYTEEGYLMFSGAWLLEDLYMLALCEREEYVALRVQPLDETYRELNRKYILPISYEGNNMFLVDWSEEDFGELDFYDMYDIFYPKVNMVPIPYVADDNLGVGAVYQIPRDEFERVIMAYFNIDSEILQLQTIYCSENETYEYRPRGFYEVEYPEYPYPEVVGASENSDGTIALAVNVVFPYAGDSKVYTHEVVVRPLEDRGVQYISNRVIPAEDNGGETWYIPRLTEEEWKEIYGGNDDVYWYIPQASDCLISEGEKKVLQSEALSAAETVCDIYRNAGIIDAPVYSSGISNFTSEQRKAVVEELGKSGLVSVTEDTDLQNYEAIEKFYADYLNGHDSMVTVFEVQRDGLLGAVTFIYRRAKLQVYYIGIRWKAGGIAEIQGTSTSDVAEINLTEKGYFIYAYETVIDYANLRQYWRIKPLSDKCRALTRKYISGLSYVDYNVLAINWDSSNVEDILMPCMFEDIYQIYTGENTRALGWEIPAEQYEKIMTTCFPVSTEQLRTHCGYIESSDSYPYEMIYSRPYPPFGEVIDYTENADGTITLFVDGVWPDYNSDCAFTNQIVVQPFEDGTFRYLSNSIEQRELDLSLIIK